MTGCRIVRSTQPSAKHLTYYRRLYSTVGLMVECYKNDVVNFHDTIVKCAQVDNNYIYIYIYTSM